MRTMQYEIHVSGTYRNESFGDQLQVSILVVATTPTGLTVRDIEEWRDVTYGAHTKSFAYEQAKRAVKFFSETQRPLREFSKIVHGPGGFFSRQ